MVSPSSPTASSGTRASWWLALVFAAGAVLHLATIRDGHSWGDDFAQYILHARNLVRGIPYAETGYLHSAADRHTVNVGPPVYPPLTAAALAPVYAAFGLSFRAMKTEMTLFLLAAVLAVLVYYRSRLSLFQQGFLLAALLLQPFLFDYRNYIGSDYLFLLLCFVALRGMEHLVSWGAGPWRWTTLSLGALLYLAWATRAVGAVLVPTLLVYVALRRRWLAAEALLACALAGGLALTQTLWIPRTDQYAQVWQTLFSWRELFSHGMNYLKEASGLWANGVHTGTAQALYTASLVLAVWGFGKAWRRGFTAVDVFVLCYLPVIVLYPSFQGLRFLIPVLPAYFVYLVRGVEALPLGARARRGATWMLAAALFVSYAGAHARRDRLPRAAGVESDHFRQVCEFVKSHTAPGDRFIFRKPRAFALMAERPAGIYPLTQDAGEMWEYLRQLDASYIVVADLRQEDFASDRTILLPFIRLHADRFHLVFRNAEYALYRVRMPPAPPGAD